MQVNTPVDDNQRHLLMHCEVTNRRGETSERFVDHAEFGLWQYLLKQKHHLAVSASEPCIWVPDEQCRQHDKLFAHAAFQMPVCRLTHQSYDERTGVTEKRMRFVPSADLDYVSDLLEQNFAIHREFVVLDIEAGEAISTAPARALFKERRVATYYAA